MKSNQTVFKNPESVFTTSYTNFLNFKRYDCYQQYLDFSVQVGFYIQNLKLVPIVISIR